MLCKHEGVAAWAQVEQNEQDVQQTHAQWSAGSVAATIGYKSGPWTAAVRRGS
jgi:hypothetical protein